MSSSLPIPSSTVQLSSLLPTPSSTQPPTSGKQTSREKIGLTIFFLLFTEPVDNSGEDSKYRSNVCDSIIDSQTIIS